MTFILAVANQKGGVAKTTTAASLGGALVKLGLDILLVDLDPQANLTLALGVDPARLRGSIADVLLSSASLSSISRSTALPGLDLAPSCSEMVTAERFLPIRPNSERILSEALHNGSSLAAYDYVLLDCPPSMGAVTLNALVAAQLLIIPTQAEYFSAHALRSMLASVRQVRSQQNTALAYRILLTMVDRRNRIHRTLSEQVRTTFGSGLFATQIETDTKLRETSAAGLPITHYFPQSRSALQYEALAQELIQHVQKSPSP